MRKVTLDEIGNSLNGVQDQIVQGYRLGRTENNLDRLEADLHRLEVVVERLADGFVLLEPAMKGIVQSATVERFIGGMEHNGHHAPDEGPEGVQ